MSLVRPPTIGVEEEFALLDPRTGDVVGRGGDVVRACHDPAGVVVESMRYMVETRTPVCHTLDELVDRLRLSRQRVGDAARSVGAVAVASGVAPFGLPDLSWVTPEPRYLELADRYPRAMSTSGTCGCHVHVGVPDRQVGVDVLLRLRPWLPVLVALAANSPIWQGETTAVASQRFRLQSKWPTVVPAPPVRSVAEYDDSVRDAVASGDALDARSVYFLARLSPRYPTIEVRAADVGLTPEETVGYAGLVRAMVGTAIHETLRGAAVDPVSQPALIRACRSAAIVGLGGFLTDLRSGRAAHTWALVEALLAWVGPQLRAYGDDAAVAGTMSLLTRLGGGAERQRRMFGHDPSSSGFVLALAADRPSPRRRPGDVVVDGSARP